MPCSPWSAPACWTWAIRRRLVSWLIYSTQCTMGCPQVVNCGLPITVNYGVLITVNCVVLFIVNCGVLITVNCGVLITVNCGVLWCRCYCSQLQLPLKEVKLRNTPHNISLLRVRDNQQRVNHWTLKTKKWTEFVWDTMVYSVQEVAI